MIRTFLSYSSLDKELAGRIKANLVAYGINAFLAHEDIEPSAAWRATILQNLRSCETFVPLISAHSANSSWTDQEAGFAISRGVRIVPVSLDGNFPYGFLADYQMMRLAVGAMDAAVLSIAKAVALEPTLAPRVLDGVIAAFEESNSFNEAKANAWTLEQFDGYTPAQKTRMMHAFLNNSQARGSFGAQKVIGRLLDRFSPDIDGELANQVERALQEG